MVGLMYLSTITCDVHLTASGPTLDAISLSFLAPRLPTPNRHPAADIQSNCKLIITKSAKVKALFFVRVLLDLDMCHRKWHIYVVKLC